MKFEHTNVYNFENAFRGLRNPKNSWQKSDSYFGMIDINYPNHEIDIADKWVNFIQPNLEWPQKFSEQGANLSDKYIDKLIKSGTLKINQSEEIAEVAFIGPNDMKLAQTLIKAGPEHRKFLRQIFVTVDITAPLYWWKQADTYKIGTTANSTSTMHKLTSKEITLDCFEIDDFDPHLIYYQIENSPYSSMDGENTTGMLADLLIEQLEFLRQKYLETKDKKYWKELVRWLPCGWLQTRTWSANYEVIRSMCSQRRGHKLNEWSGLDDSAKPNFIAWAHTLPYAEEFIFYNGKTKEENN